MFGSILVHLGRSSLPKCSSCMHSHCQFIAQSIRERLNEREGMDTREKGSSISPFFSENYLQNDCAIQLVNVNEVPKIYTNNKVTSYFAYMYMNAVTEKKPWNKISILLRYRNEWSYSYSISLSLNLTLSLPSSALCRMHTRVTHAPTSRLAPGINVFNLSLAPNRLIFPCFESEFIMQLQWKLTL